MYLLVLNMHEYVYMQYSDWTCMVSFCFSVAGSGSESGSGFGIDIMDTVPPFEFQVGPLFQACIDITINDDDDLEGDHAFTVELGVISIPALGGVGTPLATTITVQDPDGMLVRWWCLNLLERRSSLIVCA